MTRTKMVTVAVCMFVICAGIMPAQRHTIKKNKMTVTVEDDKNCPQDLSVSGRFAGGLCEDYPEGVSDRLQKLAVPRNRPGLVRVAFVRNCR